MNEKNLTLQNIDKIQNIIETLDYPNEFNFMQLSLSTYDDSNEEEYDTEYNIPSPQLDQPILSRNIDIQKWFYGAECFYKLKSQ